MPASPHSGHIAPLDIMTFNLRYASASTPHSWAERRPVTCQLLRRESPHLIGTQGASTSNCATLSRTLAQATRGSAPAVKEAATVNSRPSSTTRAASPPLKGKLVDSWTRAAKRGEQYGTWHGYEQPVPGGVRIDWILTSPDVITRYAAVNLHCDQGRYPSDHLPVQAVIALPQPGRL